MDRVVVLADVQNIYYTVKKAHNCHFDYKTFWRRATSNRDVLKANAYAIDRADKRQKQFQDILRTIGFEVKLKPLIQRSDGTAKGDWDVGITLDALEYAKDTDVIVLASGDGDFDLLVDTLLTKHGTRVEVYGVPQLTAISLMKSASKFIPIDSSLLLSGSLR